MKAIIICLSITTLIFLIIGLPMLLVGCDPNFVCPLFKEKNSTITNVRSVKSTCGGHCISRSAQGQCMVKSSTYVCYYTLGTFRYDDIITCDAILNEGVSNYIIGQKYIIYVSIVDDTCRAETQQTQKDLVYAGFVFCMLSVLTFIILISHYL